MEKVILILIALLPFQLALNPAPGFDVPLLRIVLPVLFLWWLISRFKKRTLTIPSTLQTFFFLSFVLGVCFSILFAKNPDWAWRKTSFLLNFWPLYFIIADVFRDRLKKTTLLKYLTLGAGAAAIVGIFQFVLQFIIGLDPALKIWQKIITPFLGATFSQAVFAYPSWLVNIGGKTIFRSIGLFPDPHMFAFFLGMLFPWAVLLAAKTEKRKEKIIFMTAACSILLANVLTFSRGGYLAALIGLAATILIFHDKIWAGYKKLFIVLSIFIILTISIPNPVSQRLLSTFSPKEGSNLGRLEMWKSAWNIANNNFLTGVGIGNYSLAIKPSAPYREPIYAHNLYLDIATETGFVNMLVWISLILAAAIAYLKKTKNDIFWSGGLVGLVIFSTHSLFETALFSVHVLPLLIIFLSLSNPDE